MAIKNIRKYKGERILFEWHDSSSYKRLKTINQVYGVCFTKEGKVMVISANIYVGWNIGGGTPEKGETPLQTLNREIDEEASVDLCKAKMIGYQKAKNLDRKGTPAIQLRYVALISKINPVKPDPDGGKIRARKFISPEQFNDYVKWGAVGRHMFKRAYSQFKDWKKVGFDKTL